MHNIGPPFPQYFAQNAPIPGVNYFTNNNVITPFSLLPSSENIPPNNNLALHNQSNKHYRIVWTEEEDKMILEFVQQFGTKNWKTLAKFYQGKTAKQLREHYVNCLKEGVIKNPFTSQEDKFILDFIKVNGRKFALLAKNMNGRTENSVKNRYYALLRKNRKDEYKSSMIMKNERNFEKIDKKEEENEKEVENEKELENVEKEVEKEQVNDFIILDNGMPDANNFMPFDDIFDLF